jgi:hypothetical protein
MGGCGNKDHGGLDIAVVWPADPGAVVSMLALRPDRLTQNWLPTETVADLAAENTKRKLPGPVN